MLSRVLATGLLFLNKQSWRKSTVLPGLFSLPTQFLAFPLTFSFDTIITSWKTIFKKYTICKANELPAGWQQPLHAVSLSRVGVTGDPGEDSVVSYKNLTAFPGEPLMQPHSPQHPAQLCLLEPCVLSSETPKSASGLFSQSGFTWTVRSSYTQIIFPVLTADPLPLRLKLHCCTAEFFIEQHSCLAWIMSVSTHGETSGWWVSVIPDTILAIPSI